MNILPAALFHLLPIIPLAFGYPYLAAATVMLVGLAYIKVFKLKVMQEEMEKKALSSSLKPDPSVKKALVFWERLTFLKPSP